MKIFLLKSTWMLSFLTDIIPVLGSCGEMDITTVFGTVIAGSSPAGSTIKWLKTILFLKK